MRVLHRLPLALAAIALGLLDIGASSAQETAVALDRQYEALRPLLKQYCLECHSTDAKEGELDLEQFASAADVRRDIAPWAKVVEMLEAKEMPPEDSPQLPADQRKILIDWSRSMIDAEIRARTGDPGEVVLRRLNNAEYTYTVCDLTGVRLDPAREFPIDGAAGEGFTNTGESLAMSPALLQKYLDASKEIASHAVLLPDGFRFSASSTRRDWADELVQQIRLIYARHTSGDSDTSILDRWSADPSRSTENDGRVDLDRYFSALVRHRETLLTSLDSVAMIAEAEKLNAKYLRLLAAMLVDRDHSSLLLDELRIRWQAALPEEVPALAAYVRAWQAQLFKFQPVAHLGLIQRWQQPVDPLPESIDSQLRIAGEPVAGAASRLTREQLVAAFDDFRDLFPAAMCHARIVPVDAVVTLLLYHREDDHLSRLMLSDEDAASLDRMWAELHYISQDALRVEVALEQILEFATQDADPKVFDPVRPVIAANAEAFRQQLLDSEASHLEALWRFATRAYRRPLRNGEEQRLRSLYDALRGEGLPHDDAFRLTLARVLASPAFLYRLEEPAAGERPAPVTAVELASRLSYFLWSSLPDDELLALAASGQLTDDETLRMQTRRMLKDPRTRRLSIEFACQWLHVRDFDQHNEKSEQAFPEFAVLRHDMHEETMLFFEDLFRRDGSVLGILNADHTFLNQRLAAHYGIPNVNGDQWQRVDGVRKYSRGGILTLASTLARQSGASRTSPILRGNWVSETLLGERLPRPPKDVPLLPDDDASLEQLTIRQLTERHTSDPACAKCHVRIDPYGFALERFDAIGRFRERDRSGHALDVQTTLMDGTKLEGAEGLRDYLVNIRREAYIKQFCRKLLGYSLGRSTQLSDEPLLAEMKQQLEEHDYRFSAAVETIVLSPQFRMIRPRAEGAPQ